MANFKELNDNMITILAKLIKNQRLCKLLKYTNNNPLSDEDIANPKELLYNQIYPYSFVTKVSEEVGTFLNIGFDRMELSEGGSFKNGSIVFRIVCHESLWRTEDGMRPYLIAEEIDKMFNMQKGSWVGKAIFAGFSELWVSKDHSGLTIIYDITDFNINRS